MGGGVKSHKSKQSGFPVSKGRRPFTSEDVYVIEQL
jgi:hypothetical protein